jgi:hypothetical protein
VRTVPLAWYLRGMRHKIPVALALCLIGCMTFDLPVQPEETRAKAQPIVVAAPAAAPPVSVTNARDQQSDFIGDNWCGGMPPQRAFIIMDVDYPTKRPTLR